MSIAYVQSANNGSGGSVTSLSASFSSNQTANNLNVVVIGTGTTGSTISSVADSASNTYTQAVTRDNGSGLVLWIYYCASIASFTGSNQVTVTWSSSVTGVTLGILEYSGLTTSSPLDGTPTSTFNFSGTPAAPNLTTTNATDLVIGAVLGDSNKAFTAGTNYTFRSSASTSGFPISGVEDQITTATGTFTGNFTCANQNWVDICAAFKTGSNTLRATASGTVSVTAKVTPKLQVWSVRQTSLNNTAGGGLNIFTNFAQPVVAGNLLVVAVIDHNGNTFSNGSDTVGTSLAVATSQLVSGISSYILYGVIPAAGTDSVGVNFNGVTANPNIWALEVVGAPVSFPLDTVSSATGIGTALNSGSVTVGTNNDFLFGYLYGTSGVASGEMGWVQTSNTTSGTLIEYNAPLTTGSFSAQGTMATAGTWVALLAAFVSSAGGTGGLRPGPLNVKIPTSLSVHLQVNFPNQLRLQINVTIAPIKTAVQNHNPIRPGPMLGQTLLTGAVHGTLRLPNLVTATPAALQSRLVIRLSPLLAATIVSIPSLLTPRYVGTLRLQIAATISTANNFQVTARYNPLRETVAVTISLTVFLNPRLVSGLLREIITGLIIVKTPGASILFEQSFIPVTQTFPPFLIRTFMGLNTRIVMRISTNLPGSTLTSGSVPARIVSVFPGNRGTVSPTAVLIPRYTGSLRQMISGTVNTSGLPSLGRLFGPQEFTLPVSLIQVIGSAVPRNFQIPREQPLPASGLCVIGSTATWQDNETEVSIISFQTASDPSFATVTSSTSVPFVPAPIFRALLVPFVDRYYRVQTINSFGVNYSNISQQTPAPAPPLTVTVSGYYIILNIEGADLIMQLNPGIDYTYVAQSIVAGPYPDYVSALNAQGLINI